MSALGQKRTSNILRSTRVAGLALYRFVGFGHGQLQSWCSGPVGPLFVDTWANDHAARRCVARKQGALEDAAAESVRYRRGASQRRI
jgi:hypothetical protein